MNPLLLDKFKERNISIYCIHVPLDNYSEYSTGNSFAESLDLKVESKFGDYRGSKCGVICKTKFTSIEDLKNLIEKAVNHEAAIYRYGEDVITGSRVAIITGGGNDSKMLEEVKQNGVNTYITGVTNLKMTEKAHQFAKENNINIIGATHYSTEKFACIKMVDFFKCVGLKSFYVEDNAVLEDM
jgi:putative NIF3 family GTP cyclohydrolase 1 type 2